MLHLKALFFAVLGLLIGTGVYAQSAQPLTLFDLQSQAEADPAATLTQLNTLLENGEVTDPRTFFDLSVLQADLTAQLGQDANAARLYLQLGQFAKRDRERFQWDPVTFFERAYEVFVALGDTANAEAALRLILEDQRDGGAGPDQIAATLDRLAALTTGAKQEGYTAQADAARNIVLPTRSEGDEGGYREVDVFYATDRARTGDTRPDRFYGGERGGLELGVATVTIPDIHQSGAIEVPSVWRLEFGPNPAKHVMLQSVTPVPAERYFAQMSETLDELGSADAFVFVHGYNVRFDAAARRAAQLAYDTGFPGIPILYSWPSRGTTVGYFADAAVVRLSGRRLARFLDDVVEQSGATTIHIVAHSMGNRALTDALELLALRRGLEPGSEPLFEQVLFAAPDVDADLFAEMMPEIRPIARRLTLYASDQDWALETSKQLHGDAPRAGQGGVDIIARDEFDSVDMSELGDDMLAHSYFADDSSALADMVALFWKNAPPQRRCGLQAREDSDALVTWDYVPGTCLDQTLVEVMTHLRKENVDDPEEAAEIVTERVDDPAVATQLVPIVSNLLGN